MVRRNKPPSAAPSAAPSAISSAPPSRAASPTPRPAFRFFDLAAELRVRIYEEVLHLGVLDLGKSHSRTESTPRELLLRGRVRHDELSTHPSPPCPFPRQSPHARGGLPRVLRSDHPSLPSCLPWPVLQYQETSLGSSATTLPSCNQSSRTPPRLWLVQTTSLPEHQPISRVGRLHGSANRETLHRT